LKTKTRCVSDDYLERGLSRFRGELRSNDLRLSQARDALVRCVLQQPGTFCIKDLVLDLTRAGVQGTHFATVYRAMPLLIDAGLIRTLHIAGADAQLYEVAFERDPLPHLLCSSCGRSIEFRSKALELLRSEIAQRFGYELSADPIRLRGRCELCH
jgi:Fur family transcriptional regulator, ferric uptake regulator